MGLISVLALSAIGQTGTNVDRLFGDVADELSSVATDASAALPAASASASAAASPSPAVVASCDVIADNESPPVGYQVREINPTGSDAFDVLCYFAHSSYGGGGFTLVAAQYEASPTEWNTGRQPGYNPDKFATPNTSFVLGSSDIPPHTDLMFGRIDGSANDVIDVVSFTYTTGNIPKTLVTSSIGSGLSYHIHRDTGGFYGSHDPENTLLTDNNAGYLLWRNTLTIDRANTSSPDKTWAYAPRHDLGNSRGYSFLGNYEHSNANSYAWAVWVR